MLSERFHVAGNRFDDPKIVLASRLDGARSLFAEQLMRGFVIQRRRCLVLAGEEVGDFKPIEIRADAHCHLRLERANRIDVFLLVAEEHDGEWLASRVGLRPGAGRKPLLDLIGRGIVVNERRPPHVVERFQLVRELHAFFQTVRSANLIMLGFDLPRIFYIASQPRVFGGVDPFAAIESLAVLVFLQLIGGEPAKIVAPNFARLEPLCGLRPNPAAFVLLVAENLAGLLVIGIFAQSLPRRWIAAAGRFSFAAAPASSNSLSACALRSSVNRFHHCCPRPILSNRPAARHYRE